MKKQIAVLITALLVLSGCYLPASFDAEIELSRTGHYKMKFDGYIVDLRIYNDLRQGKLTQQRFIKPVTDKIIADFKRDSNTRSVSYFGKGAFKVNWAKNGDLIRSPLITFFRRNENMLSISYNKNTSRVTMAGKSISRSQANQLNALGLGMRGIIKIRTDTKVISHNAHKVTRDGLITTYGWELKTVFDKAPKLVVAFP